MKKLNRILIFQFVLLSAFSQFSFSEHVIFDLGGVLVHTNSIAAFREIGIPNLVAYLATGKSPIGLSKKIRYRLYGFLETIYPSNTTFESRDEHGVLLPPLICCWLNGKFTTRELREIVATGIKEHSDFFTSSAERNLLHAITQMTFTPERLIKTRKINKAGFEFVQSCKQAGHTVYVLSNWDAQSLELLTKRYPKLFEFFDGIVTSGSVHSSKPELPIYEHLLNAYALDPEKTIFLDDRPENLATAQTLGMHTILCTPEKVKTFGTIYDEINQWLRSR